MNVHITKAEIQSAIEKVKPGKACGPDGIPPKFYRACGKVKSSVIILFTV